MKKFLRKLRKPDHQTSSTPIKQSYVTKNNSLSVSSSRLLPLLEDLANSPDRLGLHLLPALPLEPITTTQSFEVDIVAVHGLGGDFFKTWTKYSSAEGESDVFWLSQLLPIDLPGARIYSFGYESRPAFSRSVATIREFAKQLLQSLLDRTEAGKLRPTIFICHSLGGIVVKQAMISAHENERFAEILRTTQAIMFMGTPHRGSDIASSLGPLVDTINFWLRFSGGSVIAGAMRDDLIATLKRDSNALDEINESFIPRAKDKHIISCFELEWPENFNQLIVTKQSALLRIPGEEDIPLQANHMNMCRFSSSKDHRYRLVVNALLRVLQHISVPVGSTSAQSLYSLTDSERRYTSYFKRDVHPVVPSERVEGTCKWFLDTLQYREWQEDENPAILWITGDAGCGKTTLMSFMTEVLKTKGVPEVVTGSLPVVMAFFCAKDVAAQNDGQSLVCGLLISILTSRRNVIRRVKKEFAPVKHEFGQSLEFLWNVLMFALDVASCDSYYMVIDALDECQAQSREKVLMCIRGMLDLYKGRDRLRHKKLKILLASQPQTMTEWRALDNTANFHHVKIEDRPSGMTQDILAVIDYKVDQLVYLRRFTVPFADGLKKALYQKAQNSFLWVSLVLIYLKTTILLPTDDPQQLLVQLPDDLKHAYTKYLPSLTPRNAGIIRRCVQLLVAGYRILTLEEIGAFLNIEIQNHRPATPQQLMIIQNSIELMFGPLIRFPDLRADFVHSTVKDYFLELGGDADNPMAKTYGTDIASAHLTVAEACINYLLHEDLSIDLFNDIVPSSAVSAISTSPIDTFQDNSGDLSDIFDIQDVIFFRGEEDVNHEACSLIRDFYAPFDYAATNWARHFASCEHVAPDALAQKVRMLSKPSNIQASNWYKYMAHQSRTIVPSLGSVDELVVAAMFDHVGALQSLLSYRDNLPDILEKRCKAGMFWAASRGHSRTVQALLEHGIHPNFLENGQSPLIVAVLGGHQSVCSTLLQTSLVDPNFQDKSGRSPLVHAVISDQHEIIRLLLAHESILVDRPDLFGFTPLLEAALSGCMECLRCLCLDGRSEFSRHDEKGRNILSYAACTESLACVELILKNLTPKEVHLSDDAGRNAISYAAERSLLPIVKRLWKSQISVAQRDANGRNAISWAVNKPSAIAVRDEENTVLQFLVTKCPEEADVKDNFGWAPLAWALERPGYLNSIKVLIELREVDINQQDQTSGRPVLSWAASEGFESITRYLLQVNGINKNLRDFMGRTPLSYAAGSGSIGALRLLLNDKGVDPSISDHQGRSPLDWARLNHLDESIEELNLSNST